MNDGQITALAREYAEEGAEEVGLPNCLQNETFGLVATETECVIKWLLRRFCLVEKEAVRKEYQRAIEQGKHAHVRCHIESRAKLQLLESLFPEIAKEVE